MIQRVIIQLGLKIYRSYAHVSLVFFYCLWNNSFIIIPVKVRKVNMLTVLLFLGILSLLVFVHEWGHFTTAKKCGMKVYEFGFGFPPRAIGWYKDPVTKRLVRVVGKVKNSLKETVGGGERVQEFPSTLYSINWLPLGGFVKIKGESGEARGEKDSFVGRPVWQRLLVLVAGVFMNFILAAALLSVGLMIGLPADFSGGIDERAIIVEPPSVLVQHVLDGSPAEQAGFQLGDTVLEIDDVSILNASQMIAYVRDHNETPLTVLVERDGVLSTKEVTPADLDQSGERRLGVVLADAGVIRYPWYHALWRGIAAAFFGAVNIIVAFFYLIKNLIIGEGLAFDVYGPVGIAVLVGQSARLGFHYLLNVTAMISFSLAVINFLPIPALDGGRALFVILEKIFRRPVSMKHEQLAHTIGFLLLLGLIVIVTVRDVIGLF